jgi:mannitol operon repressor
VRDEDVKRFNEFLSEFQNESDRGAALVGAAMIDTTLADTLESFMVRGKIADKLLNGATAPLQSLAARINVNFALGLINENTAKNATRSAGFATNSHMVA